MSKPVNQCELASALLNPAGYAMIRLGRDLYQWQGEVLGELEHPCRVALKTCNESGKTSLVIAALVLWHLENFKNGLVVTTSGSYLQITQQLYPALRALSNGIAGIKILKDSGTCEHSGGRLISFSTDDPGRAEGWHEQQTKGYHLNPLSEWGVCDRDWDRVEQAGNSSLLIIIDEAKSVPDPIWHAFERCHPTRYLVASSTGASAGMFYDCFNADAERWRPFSVDVTMCPHLWDNKLRRLDIESQNKHLPQMLTDSMFWAKFAGSGDNCLFNAAKLDIAMSGLVPKWGIGMKRAGMDLSGGGDGAPLYCVDGNDVEFVVEKHERDHEKFVRDIIPELLRRSIREEMVNCDNGGLGQPIITHFHNKKWAVNRVDFGGKPKRDKWYMNLRAEMYCWLAELVNREAIRLPNDPELKKQLLWMKFLPGYKQLQLIPKKELPYSPNRADAVVLATKDIPDPAEAAEYLTALRGKQKPTSGFTGKFTMFDHDDDEIGGGLFS